MITITILFLKKEYSKIYRFLLEYEITINNIKNKFTTIYSDNIYPSNIDDDVINDINNYINERLYFLDFDIKIPQCLINKREPNRFILFNYLNIVMLIINIISILYYYA